MFLDLGLRLATTNSIPSLLNCSLSLITTLLTSPAIAPSIKISPAGKPIIFLSLYPFSNTAKLPLSKIITLLIS